MRTSKQLLMATRVFAREFRALSWWYLFSTLAVFLIFIAGAAAPLPVPVRIACGIIAGLVYVRLFILYHDYQHGNILQKNWVAWAIMTVYGLVTLNPPSIWKRSHDHHHKHNAKLHGTGIGTYPLMTTQEYAQATFSVRFGYGVVRHPLLILLAYFTVFLYGMCLRSLIVNPRLHLDSALALLIHGLMLGSLLYYAPASALFVVILPSLIASMMGAYLFYAQHNCPGVRMRSKEEWTYVSAALEASSFMKMSRLMHWFTGNIGYHHVHHLNHKIPFYRLPEAMAAMPELQNPVTTSLHPWDVYKCLQLKLYDTETDRMVSFKTARQLTFAV